jgi:hypothetical protein
MAAIFPDEGLDVWLGQWPKNDTRETSSNLCLFTSQTATTVITHAQAFANVTETTYTSYARQAMATATWGALSEYSSTLGRQTTYPQVTFPTVGASGATINGFHITNTANTKVVAQANFTDLTAVPLLTNDVIKVTPTVALLH